MIPARTTRALLVDVWGAAYYIYPERGYYFLDLAGANCAQGCQMGGAPLMLVEEAALSANTAPLPPSPTPPLVDGLDPDATTDPDALPTPTPTFTPAPTLTPSPTSTPTLTSTSAPTPTSTPTPTGVPSPTPTITLTPSVTPVPIPTSDIPPSRPWLLFGVLALAIGGTAIAADRGKPPSRRP